MSRPLTLARLWGLFSALLFLAACGGGGGPLTPTGQNLLGTLSIEIRSLAAEQNSAVIPITLSVPRTNAVDPIPVYLRIGWRRANVLEDPQRLMTAAPGSLDLNNRNTIIQIPVEGREVTFLWDALADLGEDWPAEEPIAIRAGILAANANDPRQAVCDFEPIINVGFGSGTICTSPIPRLSDATLDEAIVGENYFFQLEGTGGEPPLRYLVVDPSTGQPSGTPDVGFGLFLNENTGAITGIPTEDAPSTITLFVRLSDSCGVSTAARAGTQTGSLGRFDQARILIPVRGGITPQCAPAPQIITTALPAAELDVPYSFQLEASGGEGNLSWTIDEGELPSGFSLDTNGLITGLPTAPGALDVTVRVSDSCESIQSATGNFELSIPCGAGPSFASPTTLPTAQVGVLYDITFFANMPNGTGTVTLQSGSMPEGVNLIPVIEQENRRVRVQFRGTLTNPDDAGKLFSVTLLAQDNCPFGNLTESGTFNIPVADTSTCTEPLPQLGIPGGGSTLPAGTAGEPYSTTLNVTGGTPPVGAIRIVSGAPAGFTIAADGRTFQGTLPASGPSSYDITFEVSDGCSTGPRTDRDTFTLPVTVPCPALSIPAQDLPEATNGQVYSATLTANGGFGTRTWSLDPTSEGLPVDLQLSADGVISGTPDDQPRTYNLVVRVEDSCPGRAQSATLNLPLVLNPAACLAPAINVEPLPDAVLDNKYAGQITATGGLQPYTFAVTSGRLPTGLTLEEDGLITGGASDPKEINVTFNFEVTVTDSCQPVPGFDVGNFSITVRPPGCDPLDITTPDLPDPTINEPYSQTLNATGVAPLSWRLSAGSLPAGLSLDGGGTISGTPFEFSELGQDFTFTAEVTDSCLGGPQTTTRTYTITLQGKNPCGPITLEPTELPDAEIGSSYAAAIPFSGGVEPYLFSITAGSLPEGLSLGAADGIITGTPDNPKDAGQTFDFTVQVIDACVIPVSDTQTYSIFVRGEACAPLDITTTDVPAANWNQTYSFRLEATGVAPFTWSQTDGDLPDGMSLDAGGMLTGFPTNAGQIGQTFGFTVEVMDSCDPEPQLASRNLTIVLEGPDCDPLSIPGGELPDPAFGAAYSHQITAEGGVDPITWRMIDGTLPSGLSFLGTGEITGTADEPDEIGALFEFTVQATDACPLGAQVAVQDFAITLQPESCAGLTITTTGLPPATNGQEYGVQLTADGGKDPLFWSATGLPPNLTLRADGFLSGTPDTDPETYDIDIEVLDSCTPAQLATVTLTLVVTDAVCDPIAIDNEFFPNPEVGVAYREALLAANGVEPYSWSLASGDLPDGLAVDPAGTLGGTPTNQDQAGELFRFTLQVVDSCENGPASMTATFEFTLQGAQPCGELFIDTEGVPDPTFGAEYEFGFEASGGVEPYAWELNDGSLPQGMLITSDGLLTGVASNEAEIGQVFNFTVGVSDSCPFVPGFTTRNFTLTLQPPDCGVVTIETEAVPDAPLDAPYNFQFQANGGQPPYTWALLESELPDGLNLTSGGALTGTPDNPQQVGAEFSIDVQVSDSCPGNPGIDIRTFTFTVTLECAPISIDNIGFPDPVFGSAYNQALQGSGQGGLTWSLASGSLPDGLSVNPAGFIQGTPTNDQQILDEFNFTLGLTDSCALPQSTTRSYRVTLQPPPSCGEITVTTDEIPDAEYLEPYSFQITAEGGQPPYTFALSDGSLPRGLALTTSGLITGIPDDPQEIGAGFEFEVEVTDSCPNNPGISSAWLFISVAQLDCGRIAIFNTGFPDPVFGEEYSEDLIGEGFGTLTWSLRAGTFLPTGMSVNPAGFLEGTPTNAQQIGQTFDFILDLVDSCAIPQSTFRGFSFTLQPPPSCGEITVTTDEIPDAEYLEPYSFQVTATGGQPPYTFALTSGLLPRGLTLTTSGLITGIPDDPQEIGAGFEFEVEVTDSCPNNPGSSSAWLFISVAQLDCGRIAIFNSGFPNPQFGVGYSEALIGEGFGTLTWSLQSGSLPVGMSVNPAGFLEGTPTNPQDVFQTFNFTLGLVDSCAVPQSTTRGYSFTLEPAPSCGEIDITTFELDNAEEELEYAFQLGATGGQPPYTWAIIGAALPPGLTMTTDGRIAGTPEPGSAGGYEFEVEVTDSCPNNPAVTSAWLFIFVNETSCPQVVISNRGFPDPVLQVPYDEGLFALWGAEPYSWSLEAGSTLPSGMSIVPQGRLAGTPNNANQVGQQFTFTIRVDDSCTVPRSDSKTFGFTLREQECTDVQFEGQELPDPFYNLPYSNQLLTNGGQAPLTFAIVQGTLPDGLTMTTDGSITGTPNNPQQIGLQFPLVFQVTDSCFPEASTDFFQWTLQLRSLCPSPVLTRESFPAPFYQQFYAEQVFWTSTTGPYTVTVSQGSLPDGLSLVFNPFNGSWIITGTPTNLNQVGTLFAFTLRVTDSCQSGAGPGIGERNYSFRLAGPGCEPPTITTQFLPDPFLGVPYSDIQLFAEGGKLPYTWAMIGGSLPDGMTFDPVTATLGGTPNNSAQAGFRFFPKFQVTDDCGFPSEPVEFTLILQVP